MKQKVTGTLTKGFIIGLIIIAIGIAIAISGVEVGPGRYIGFSILFIGVIISILQYGKQIDYNSSFGNYFSHGFKITALVTILMIVYVVVFFNLFPEYKEKAIDAARAAMNKQKDLSEEEINRRIEMTSKFFMVVVIGATLLFNLIIGAIASLIGAGVTKKNPRPLED